MRMLVRRDPFAREISAWRNTMERAFEDAVEHAGYWDQPASWTLALDVAEDENAYFVTASIAGINPDDIEITLNDNVLTVRGETEAQAEKEGVTWHLKERRYGSFQRSLTLPTPVDVDSIEATYIDGVLNLNVPKVEEVKPKRIAVNAN